MSEESDLEKTEEPTGRRLEQAREKGQVPHSRELGTFLVLMTSAALFWSMGGWLVERSLNIAKKSFIIENKHVFEPSQMLVRFADLSIDTLFVFSPILGVMVLASVLPPFFLNAWVFAPNAFMPDFNRLNPMTGIGRMFSWNSLMELGKALFKALLVGGIALLLIVKEKDEIFGLLGESLESAMAHTGHLLTYSFLILVSTLILVVAVDVPFQLWQHYEKLKMTKEEVKQEMKEMMGDPHVKGRIRSLQMEAARKRMMAAVPDANVVVTNPTHYSVALSYKAGMAAPKVVAKGMGTVALKIREIAAESAVPIMEAPPLARALYKHAELDREIPSALYSAVAEILAYIYQLAGWKQQGGAYPQPPKDLDIPADLIPEAS